ncbi:hypothetical protein J7E88_07100 [Streptomyces sp. ISL-10]|uniref:hypothetical protein n=1 Tax=Streptomyces sp. ISL-10 TaxID=2819172 RepID=UPI001BE544F6|nr:hypothetical protein [Streptomyces sp. ISL-10]MBT2365091.1 hypothetical protein [Streptomyces sp. ISL-10]
MPYAKSGGMRSKSDAAKYAAKEATTAPAPSDDGDAARLWITAAWVPPSPRRGDRDTHDPKPPPHSTTGTGCRRDATPVPSKAAV